MIIKSKTVERKVVFCFTHLTLMNAIVWKFCKILVKSGDLYRFCQMVSVQVQHGGHCYLTFAPQTSPHLLQKTKDLLWHLKNYFRLCIVTETVKHSSSRLPQHGTLRITYFDTPSNNCSHRSQLLHQNNMNILLLTIVDFFFGTGGRCSMSER